MRKKRDRRRPPASSSKAAAAQTGGSTTRRRWLVLALLAFAIGFISLEVAGYTREAATWDEPMHLTSGYAALAHQDYRIDPSHPPFVRMWAALPVLLFERPSLDLTIVDQARLPGWLSDAYAFAHEFLYVHNDADRLLNAARFMVVLLGVALGILLFAWTYEWLGLLPAMTALILYTVEPNLAAHAMLVTTDLGVTCFMFGAVYFLWRTIRAASPGNIVGLSACCALAMVTKFSAILLPPIVVVLLAIAVRRGSLRLPMAARIVAVITLTTVVAIWAVYGFRHDPGPTWSFEIAGTAMGRGVPALSAVVGWIDRHGLLPNAYSQGFLYNQSSVQELNAYLAGRYSTDGWWYYFPFAFAIKTPIALIALFAAGIFFLVRGRAQAMPGMGVFIAVPVAIYLSAAMTSGVNIGLRHILPVYPFAILVAAAAVKPLLASTPRAGAAVFAVALIAAATEYATAYPYPLTFFNQLVGGPVNGFRYLADSNLGWGQSLKALKRWMGENGVMHVNLAYFGQADPAYYNIGMTRLPGAPDHAITSIARPQLPGYVAIGGTVLTGVYLMPQWRLFYRPFHDLEPVAVVGNSMRIYYVERWPEATTDRYAGTAPPEAHRALADALLFGWQWPTRAIRHYRAYLATRPDDPQAMVNAGLALASNQEMDAATQMLREAVERHPNHMAVRLTVARLLFSQRALAEAEHHVRAALALDPLNAATHDLLGRLRADQGHAAEAVRHFEQALAIDPDYTEARDHLEYMK